MQHVEPLESWGMKKGRIRQPSADGAAFLFEVEFKAEGDGLLSKLNNKPFCLKFQFAWAAPSVAVAPFTGKQLDKKPLMTYDLTYDKEE
jgi:hypothetical protein